VNLDRIADKVVESVGFLIHDTEKLAILTRKTWIRRIQASPKATKPWIDRLQTHTVDFRQFLTIG
jgi:hypothetical protein